MSRDGGLYGKYVVKKANGEPVDDGADYFVLRIDKDPHARLAARLYAESIERENPQLAAELRDRVEEFEVER